MGTEPFPRQVINCKACPLQDRCHWVYLELEARSDERGWQKRWGQMCLSRLVAECPTPRTPYFSSMWKPGFHFWTRKGCVCGAAVPLSPLSVYYAKFWRPPWRKAALLCDRGQEHKKHGLSCPPGPGKKPKLAVLAGHRGASWTNLSTELGWKSVFGNLTIPFWVNS